MPQPEEETSDQQDATTATRPERKKVTNDVPLDFVRQHNASKTIWTCPKCKRPFSPAEWNAHKLYSSCWA